MTGLHEEFDRAATWAETSLSFDKDLNVPWQEHFVRSESERASQGKFCFLHGLN